MDCSDRRGRQARGDCCRRRRCPASRTGGGVLADGTAAQERSATDGLVREPFGHELQHRVLTLVEPFEPPTRRAVGEQSGDGMCRTPGATERTHLRARARRRRPRRGSPCHQTRSLRPLATLREPPCSRSPQQGPAGPLRSLTPAPPCRPCVRRTHRGIARVFTWATATAGRRSQSARGPALRGTSPDRPGVDLAAFTVHIHSAPNYTDPTSADLCRSWGGRAH
jgi:hypothetical protein